MLRKNIAGQRVFFALVNATTGAALTGATVTARRALDAAAQAAATGTVTELANGQYRFDPSQADTNGDYVGFLFTAANAIPVNANFITTAGNFADAVRFGLTALPNAVAEATGGLYTRGTGAGQINQAANGQVDSNITHAAGTAWGSGAITAASIAANAITDTKIATGAFTAAKFAAGAFDAVWTVTARLLTAGTNIALAKGTGVTGFNDIAAADVWAAATRTLSAGTNIVLAKGTGVTGFNDLSAAQVNTEVDTALADYDGPTATELVAEIDAVQADIAALNDVSSADVATAVWSSGTRLLTAGTNIVLAKNVGVTGFDDLNSAEVANAVWDEVLTGATHNVATSAGRRLRELGAAAIRSATAQAGAASSITLDASASTTNEIYDSNLVVIVEGTGVGQARVIVQYDGTTKVAIVDRVWAITPDNTSVFQVLAAHQADIVQHGKAQAGAATTITLAATASAVDDVYIGSHVFLSISGQTRLVTGYNGTTKVATISPAWTTNPSADSVYKILPVGRSIPDALSSQAKADVNAEVLDVLTVDTFAQPGQEAPAATTTLHTMLRYLYKFTRNKLTNDGTETKVFADDGTTVDHKATVGEAAGEVTRGKFGSGA